MRRFISFVPMIALLGCIEVPTGILTLVDETLQQAEVGEVICPSTLLAVGDTMDCFVLNTLGTVISPSGSALVPGRGWVSFNTDVLLVDVFGVVSAVGVGESLLGVNGANQTFASIDITVVEELVPVGSSGG